MVRKYRLATLGCKVNQYESQVLREVLESFGLRPAGAGEVADLAIVNTCAVTTEASRKNRQTIRRLARGGETPVVVVGCGATAEGDQLHRLGGVTAVLGHDRDTRAELRNLLRDQLGWRPLGSLPGASPTSARVHESPPVNGDDLWMKPNSRHFPGNAPVPGAAESSKESISTLPLPVKSSTELTARIKTFVGHQRAFLKVQDGCDAYCTYCIIPRLRPALRSKPIAEAVAEAHDLVRSGHKEIIMTGIFLGAYGRETALRKRWRSARPPLACLVEALARVEGLERLRLSSLEPGDVDASLLEVLATNDKCVPHLHLPLQSGSPAILRRMNRQYTPDAFIEMIDRVRSALDRPAISTDIIVGFPGETESDFGASLAAARYAGFCKIHAFPFSAREHTAAARWQKDFVPRRIVRERMQRLADVERDLSSAFRRQFIGQVDRVIVEDADADCADGPTLGTVLRRGRGDRYFEIHFENDQVKSGDVVFVRIDRVTPTRTHGSYLPKTADRVPVSAMRAG